MLSGGRCLRSDEGHNWSTNEQCDPVLHGNEAWKRTPHQLQGREQTIRCQRYDVYALKVLATGREAECNSCVRGTVHDVHDVEAVHNTQNDAQHRADLCLSLEWVGKDRAPEDNVIGKL